MAQSNLPDVGTGATLTFESGLFATIDSVEWSGATRGFGETTHLGTTTARTFKPGDLYDPGSLTVSMRWSKDQPFLTKLIETDLSGADSTMTITFPTQTGESTPTTLAGKAFLTSISGTIALEDVMTARGEIKFTGAITHTVAT